MCHDNGAKLGRGIDLSVQNWHEESDEFWSEHSKISKTFTLEINLKHNQQNFFHMFYRTLFSRYKKISKKTVTSGSFLVQYIYFLGKMTASEKLI